MSPLTTGVHVYVLFICLHHIHVAVKCKEEGTRNTIVSSVWCVGECTCNTHTCTLPGFVDAVVYIDIYDSSVACMHTGNWS